MSLYKCISWSPTEHLSVVASYMLYEYVQICSFLKHMRAFHVIFISEKNAPDILLVAS